MIPQGIMPSGGISNAELQNMMSTQLLTTFAIKDNSNIYQILLLFIITKLAMAIPAIFGWITNYFDKKMANAKLKLLETDKDKMLNGINYKLDKNGNKISISGSILYTKDGSTSNNVVVDALNNYIINLDSAKELKYTSGYYVTNDKEFEIENNIYCKTVILLDDSSAIRSTISNGSGGNKQSVNNVPNISYTILIYSYTYKLEDLKKFIDRLYDKYIYEQNNKLGNRRYYFDELPVKHNKMLGLDGKTETIQYDTISSELNFSITPFFTNKSLTNVYGEHLNIVKERLDLFINNRTWYESRGIPYTLGILLHGPPGTGKTSLIKAIAKDTKRHIFNIKLSEYTTQSQLRKLFYDDTVTVVKNNKEETFKISIEERMFVIEDIDCLTDVVLSRDLKEKENKNEIEKETKNKTVELDENSIIDDDIDIMADRYSRAMESRQQLYFNTDTERQISKPTSSNNNKNNEHPEKLTLSFILNLFDGILETPGRIIIITTNHPEKLDKAFIRPGRIDINLKVGYCTLSMIKEMYYAFYKFDYQTKYSFTDIKSQETKITPAELNSILLNNFNDHVKAYEEIKNIINNN